MRNRAAFFIGFLLLALLAAPPVCAVEQAPQIVRVGWYESSFNITDQFGRRSGYAYEYQQKIAAYTGWTYEYVYGSWPELYQMLLDGKLDLMSDISYTEERAGKMLFSAFPMGSEAYYACVSKDSASGVTSEDLSTFDGKRIGVSRGSFQEGLLLDWAEKNGIQAEVVELMTGDADSIAMLDRGEIDVYVSVDDFGAIQEVVPVCKIGSSDFYFAVNMGRPDLLRSLDAAMNRIQDENRNYNQRVQEKYFSSTVVSLYITRNEMDWLSAHGTIRVGYQDDYLPFCGQDRDTGGAGGALGVFLDLASRCMQNAVIDFEAIAYPAVEDALDALRRGEIDCVFPVHLTAYDGEEIGVITTTAMMQTEMYAAVRSADQRGVSLQGAVTVALHGNNPNYETFLMDNFPHWKRLYLDSPEDCFQAVADGTADCVLFSNYRLNKKSGDV